MKEYPYCVKESPIHGNGLFTTRKLKAGELIPIPPKNKPQFKNYGGMNHADEPNADFSNKGIHILRDIEAGEEITVKYTFTPWNMTDEEAIAILGDLFN